jgi:hypothetical protein
VCERRREIGRKREEEKERERVCVWEKDRERERERAIVLSCDESCCIRI